jgi:cytochrome c oxidase subunit 4
MEHTTESTEITYHHEPGQGTARIWRTFWLLLGITLVELALGFSMYLFHESIPTWLVLFIKGVIVILSLAKAFYIVSIFMHLGDEIKNMIMTIVVPLMLFIWFIGAFLWDGSAYRTSRNRYDKSMVHKTEQAPAQKKDTAVHPLH